MRWLASGDPHPARPLVAAIEHRGATKLHALLRVFRV
jgi:hypothetical protein